MIEAFSVKQPYAWLMANRLKRMQPITWKSDLRGPIVLHASRSFPESLKRLCTEHKTISGVMRGIKPESLLCGALIAVLFIEDCVPVEELMVVEEDGAGISHREFAFGTYLAGKHVLLIKQVRQLKTPIEIAGQKGIWKVPPQVVTPELERIVREMGEGKC